MRLNLITANTEEALTTDEVKDNLRETDARNNERIDDLIVSAREEWERYTQGILLLSTWDLYLDEFPSESYIELPHPLSSVTSVKYQDTSDVEQTFSAVTGYDVDIRSRPGRVFLRYGQSWPSTYAEPNVIVVRFIAGYATADAVPKTIRNGMLLYIAHHYENREPVNIGNIVAPINRWEACWGNEARFPI